MSKPLIEVKDLKVYFKQKSPKLLSFKPGILKAVDEVSFSIEKGKTDIISQQAVKSFMRAQRSETWEKKIFFHIVKKCSLFSRIRIHPWTQAIQYRILSVSLWRSTRCILQKNEKTVQKS